MKLGAKVALVIPVWIITYLFSKSGLLPKDHPYRGGMPMTFFSFVRGATPLAVLFGAFFWLQIPMFIICLRILNQHYRWW